MDTTHGEYGYVNAKGDTAIQLGKYPMCYTDKFDKFAIVSTKDKGLVGIDRNENVVFNVYVFDNGPDYPSNGLFRIIKDGKIGYANLNGQIVIQPQFDCAYPFKNGKAKVGKGCKEKTDGEHRWWTEGNWYTIDKKGKVVKTNYSR
ncbi:MAG: WG repeat-containing protein [Flavisolibacter sp.]